MSELDEKLSTGTASVGRTLAKLSDLRKMWGTLTVLEGTPDTPTLIARVAMGDKTFWRRQSQGAGQNAVFQMLREG